METKKKQTSYFRNNIEKMSGYVPGEQPQGGLYIKLNTNENPYAPSPKVLTALKNEINDRVAIVSGSHFYKCQEKGCGNLQY